MLMKILLFVLMMGMTKGYADERHHDTTPEVTTTSTTALTLPIENTYGLLALSAGGLQFDWGVPDKLQLSFAGAFTEGGNQSMAVGVGTRFGGIMVNASFITTLSAPENEDDYAIVIGGTMRF